MAKPVKKVVITGAGGLIGWHAHARLHAANCAARFKGMPEPYDIVALDHGCFQADTILHQALTGADGVLHFAGINRAPEDEVEAANPAIARHLVKACASVGASPHIVYANSTHARSDTPYGRSKRIAGEVLEAAMPRYCNLVLPHIFGEGARPNYNNVTATLIDNILAGKAPSVNPDGHVQLLHAGVAAQTAINIIEAGKNGTVQPSPTPMSVPDLLAKLNGFHELAQANIYPDLSNPFDVDLFNSYRAATFPQGWPRPLKVHSDARGILFEAVKGGGGGQCFLSTTKPGITRGDHFHLAKVERFLVIQGEAVIRMRKVLGTEVWEYPVSGDTPSPVDMPTLYTHSIENVGTGPLLTLFWTHDLFDPEHPDTYADKVLS